MSRSSQSMNTMCETQTDRIAKAFCNCTLPHREWTHKAHFRVVLWHLLRYSPTDVMTRLRDGIRQYNRARGIPNTDSSGYHETITRFYITLVADFLEGQDISQPVDRLVEHLWEAYGDRDLPFIYYSKERLMSKEARREWVEPDRTSLPKLTRSQLDRPQSD